MTDNKNEEFPIVDEMGNIKDIQPDKWDTACGGHVDLGEKCEPGASSRSEGRAGYHRFRTGVFRTLCL